MMTTSASCSPETTTNHGLLSIGPRSNSSSLSPDGGFSCASGNSSHNTPGDVLSQHLHLLQQRSFCMDDMNSPVCNSGNGSSVGSSVSWLQQENDYFKELAELLHENLNRPEMLQGVNSQALRDMIRQLQQLKDTKTQENAIQHGDVSSSGPTLLASHIGPMLLEALDGFFLVMNTDGFVEFVSQNVQKYLNYSQAEMLNKPIYNFTAPGDDDLFSRLLPDSMAWHLLNMGSPNNGGRERQSHTFMCRFVVNGNSTMMKLQDHFSTSCQPVYANLQVSAISLPYPNPDGQRDVDEFLSFTPVTDSQPCLVCVARRLPESTSSNNDNSSTNHCNIQRVNNPIGCNTSGVKFNSPNSASNNVQDGIQFSLVCKADTMEICQVNCKDTRLKQIFTPRDPQQQTLTINRLRNLCHPSDQPLLDSHIRNVLDHGSDCVNQLRMYLPPSLVPAATVTQEPASTSLSGLLFLKAKSRLVSKINDQTSSTTDAAVQLDFTLLRVSETASSSSTPVFPSSTPHHSNNAIDGCVGQNTSPEMTKSLLVQQNQYHKSPLASTLDLSVPQSIDGEFVSSSYADRNHDSNADTSFQLFLDSIDCFQSGNSQTQQQFGSCAQQHDNGNRQLPSSTTLSPAADQQIQIGQQQSYRHCTPGKAPPTSHHRHASGPRKTSTVPGSRCPSALSEPVSSTAGGYGTPQSNDPDDLQRLCSMFFDSPEIDSNVGQQFSSSTSSPANFVYQSNAKPQTSPYQQLTPKSELCSPTCQQKQQSAQYGESNILKNLLSHDDHQQQQQQEYCSITTQTRHEADQKLDDLMIFPQSSNANNDTCQSMFGHYSGPMFGTETPMGTGMDHQGPTRDPVGLPPGGRTTKGNRKAGANKNIGGGRKSKKALQQQKQLLEQTAQQSPVLEQLLKPELGSAHCAASNYLVGANQPQMQILQSLLQEDDPAPLGSNMNCTVANSAHGYPRSAPITPMSNSPILTGATMNAIGSPGVSTSFTPAPTNRKRRGSSYACATNANLISQSASMGAASASSSDQGQPITNCNLGPPQPKQSNSLLVQLLEQAAPQTRTLPTSIASSPLDKLAKENKENPNKPRVSTVLVETLLTRPRTSAPTTVCTQQQHQLVSQAPTPQAPRSHMIGGPSLASPYVSTPPMFVQQQSGGMGQSDYGNGQGPFATPTQAAIQNQQYQQHVFQQGLEPPNAKMQFMDAHQYGGMVAPPMEPTRPQLMQPSPAGMTFQSQQQHQVPQRPPVRAARQGLRQPAAANVRHQLLLQQQQKRGKHSQPTGAHQQMAMNMFPQHLTPRPPPYPGSPQLPPAIPQPAARMQYQQQSGQFRHSAAHFPQSQSLPNTPTMHHNMQSPQQQQIFNFDSNAPFSPSPLTAGAAGAPLFSPSVMASPGGTYGPRMPQQGSIMGSPSPLAPSDVVRHELRQAVQNRAHMHQHQATLVNGQQFQQQQYAAWQRSQSIPGQMDRRGTKDFGSPPGVTTMQQTECVQQQIQHAALPNGTVPQTFSNVGGPRSFLQQQLLSPPSSTSRSNSGAPPTDPTPTTGNGLGMEYDGVDNQNSGTCAAPGQTGGMAHLEASWNFDLGFENGLDMDDESTRNFLQQLLD